MISHVLYLTKLGQSPKFEEFTQTGGITKIREFYESYDKKSVKWIMGVTWEYAH